MGCGILFPNDYDSEVDSDPSPDDPEVNNMNNEMGPNKLYDSDSEDSDEEDMLWQPGREEQGTKVQVMFAVFNGKCLPTTQFHQGAG